MDITRCRRLAIIDNYILWCSYCASGAFAVDIHFRVDTSYADGLENAYEPTLFNSLVNTDRHLISGSIVGYFAVL
jgi:hypothetical protein